MKRITLSVLALGLMCLMSEARQPHSGYRGFLEWSNSLRSDKFGWPDLQGNIVMYRQNSFYTGATTSHGYQIDPMFFIGAGLGMEKCGDLGNWIVPVFVQGRADFLFGIFTPFADVRLGYNLAEGTGMYFSPSIGYRLNWGRKMGVNLGVGLTLAGYKAEHYEGTVVGPDDYLIQYVGRKSHTRAYFSFRLGIDF